jgi:hypothetical protein
MQSLTLIESGAEGVVKNFKFPALYDAQQLSSVSSDQSMKTKTKK